MSHFQKCIADSCEISRRLCRIRNAIVALQSPALCYLKGEVQHNRKIWERGTDDNIANRMEHWVEINLACRDLECVSRVDEAVGDDPFAISQCRLDDTLHMIKSSSAY